MLSPVRLSSVCHLSVCLFVTLVHPTQAVVDFGTNITSLLLLKPQVSSVMVMMSVTVTAGATGWPLAVGVVEVGMVDTRYGVSQLGADAER